MKKEAIALLEKARSVARVAEPNKAGYECIEQHIDQALTILKRPKTPHPCNYVNLQEAEQPTAGKPKCKTCGGSKKIQRKEKQHCRLLLCADLTIPSCFRCPFYIHEKPCPDCLDRVESIKTDLLGLCEEFMEKADNGSADFDDPEPGSIYLRAEAIIAKAKKEG